MSSFYKSKEKSCIDCGKPYQPTSNRQSRCPTCKTEHKPLLKKPRLSHARAGAIKKADIPIGREPEGTKTVPSPIGSGQAKISITCPDPIGDGKLTAYLAQLVYASELLDQQIKLAIEEGVIDMKTMLDIRYRIGAILRGTAET